MKRLILTACLALVALTMIGCDDPAGLIDSHWKFVNRSSYGVNVSARDEQDWGSFYLPPGESRKVTVDGTTTIKYTYSPSNKVWADQANSDSEIYFRNR